MIKKNNRSILRGLVFVLLFTLLIGGVFLWLSHRSQNTANTLATNQKHAINYGPPTSAEQKAGNEQKQINANQQANQQPQSNANITISNTSQSGDTVRVRAFVSNAVESGGICTTTLTLDNNTVTKQTTAFPDASTTQCGAIDFTRSQFASAGSWQVTVTYKSPTLSGSATSHITIG